MKSAFDDITLKWHDKTYSIASTDVMEAIARIEEHVTIDEVHRSLSGGGIKRVKLSRAFASLLRFAKAAVTDEEVYKGMFVQGQGNLALASTLTLMAMMVPPSLVAEAEAAEAKAKLNGGESPSGNPPRRERRAAASSSRKRTKRLSGSASPRQNSGG